MAKFFGGRPSFRQWIDKQPDPNWETLPLTHVAKALVACDIIQDGQITPQSDEVFDQPVAYFFYGRPCYRVSGDGSIKSVAACPLCFVMDPKVANSATAIHAFDTGAFRKRLYSAILMDEMEIEDFGLGDVIGRANKLISSVFGSKDAYIKGDLSHLNNVKYESWEFHTKAYLDLLMSPGRNEPDDRVSAIEFVFKNPVPIKGSAKAIIVPHILWDSDKRTPWLLQLEEIGIEISTYEFLPGKSPDYYYAQMQTNFLVLCKKWGLI